jgi:radical SAM superfamily enzyme YgiQ (UPF0313 family)
MDINIIAVNSKFIHKSLVPWYLKAQIEEKYSLNIGILEYTINDNIDHIVEDIFFNSGKYLFFSCYIWNIEIIYKIIKNLKKINRNFKIFLGGPEVSFDIDEIFKNNDSVDFIIKGEGEIPFKKIIELINIKNEDFNQIEGVYSSIDKSFDEFSEFESDLDNINSPYTKEMLNSSDNKIIYFESSRGCPFNCSYCLSSVEKHNIRFFSIKRVKDDIKNILKSNTRQIKFIDRTFNCNRQRFFEIIHFINDLETEVNFHFEISAILIDDEIINFLKNIKPGRIQFEIGIQSTNIDTLKSVNRSINIEKLLYNIKRIISLKNIHVHVDLIAGLPYEDFFSFKNSFNDVYNLYANQFQLGFLKLLRGTKIREEEKKFSYIYKDYPPYEIIRNKYIDFKSILKLKNIEELIDKYYNSEKFSFVLEFIDKNGFFNTAFDFYLNLNEYYKKSIIKNQKLSMISRYDYLLKFLHENIDKDYHNLINEILKFDYLVSDNTKFIPEFLNRENNKNLKQNCIKFLENNHNGNLDFIEYKKYIKKNLHFEIFNFNFVKEENKINLKLDNILRERFVIAFDYAKKSKVNKRYKFFKISNI